MAFKALCLSLREEYEFERLRQQVLPVEASHVQAELALKPCQAFSFATSLYNCIANSAIYKKKI